MAIDKQTLNKLSTKDLEYFAANKMDKMSDAGLNIIASASTQSYSADPSVPTPMGTIEPRRIVPERTLGEQALGVGEAALSTLTGATTGTASGLANMFTPKPQENIAAEKAQFEKMNPNLQYIPQEQAFFRGAERATYSPRTEAGQEYAGKLGEFINSLGLQGLMGMPISPKSTLPKIKPEKSGLTSNVVGMTTGTGAEALSQAYKAGKAGGEKGKIFIENMRQEVPIDTVLNSAKQTLQTMKANKSADYVANKAGWAADTTPLDFTPIEQSFKSLEDSLKVQGKWKIGKDEVTKINEVRQVINDWKKSPSLHTTVGLDALKQRIDAIYPDSPKQSQAQRVITGASNSVKDTIIRQAPDYAEAMKDYEVMSSTIKEIEAALSLGNKASKDTALRKLQSLTRNNVQTNYGGRLDMARQLEQVGGENIMPAVSGQALSSLTPRGLAGQGGASLAALASYFNPATLATLPVTSPRLMGETAYKLGQTSNYLPSIPRIPFKQNPQIYSLLMQQEQGQ
jgi:hypothetical protein